MKFKHYYIQYIGIVALSILLIFSENAAAQQTVTGSVTNKAGDKITQVVIVNKRTEKPIKVDSQGQFQFISDKTDTLMVLKEGYEQQQVIVKSGNTSIKIVLNELGPFANSFTLPFGATISNQYYTGSVSSISGDAMERFHVPNATNSIKGRVPGLITRAGSDEPGYDDATFYIRGITSFNSYNPNVYVDNVPVSFSQLDPIEIDQLQVFKDGVSNGVYGMDGANKSIFVTTKRGEAYNKKINFYSTLTFQQPTALPKFLGAQRYMQLYNEARVNDGLPALYTQSQIDAYNNGSDPITNPDADWYGDNLKKTSAMQKYDLSISGGNNAIRYYILGGLLTQQGLFKNTENNFDKYGYSTNASFNKYNLRSNFDFTVSKSLTAFVDLSIRVLETTSPGTTGGSSDIFTNLAKYPPNLFPVVFPDGTIGGNSQYTANPYGMITRQGYTTNVNRVTFGNVGLKQDMSGMLKGLSASASYSFYNSFTDVEGFGVTGAGQPVPTFAVYSYVNGVKQTVGKDVLPVYEAVAGTQIRIGTFWAKANYSTQIGADNKVDVNIGYNQSKKTPAGDNFPYSSINFFAQGHYQYKDKYLADVSLSRSTTEVFPDNGHRYGMFPSFGAGWILSKEDFLATSKVISFLKLRATYALLGNGRLGGTGSDRYYYVDLYKNTGTVYQFGQTTANANGYAEGALSNQNVTWEKQNMFNGAVDAAFLNNKLGFTFEVFNERRSQILVVPGNISSLIGQTTRPLNLGIVNNKGIDASIWYKNNISDFNYYASANLSLNRNNIIYNAESAKAYAYLNTSGQSYGEKYGLTAIGLFKNTAEIASSPVQTFQQVQPGDVKYLDRNGDNVIDNNDFGPIGKPSTPQVNYGFELGMAYKKFDLTVNLQGAGGFTVDLRSNATYGFANGARPSVLMEDRWTPATAETALYPRLSFNSANNYQTSTFWMKEARFIRLKNVELGYNLYARFLQNVGIKKVRLYASGLNLATWSNLGVDFVDPEDESAGISSYPRLRNIVFGLNVQF